MNRKEYIGRVLPIISSLGEEKTDMIMDKIASYLVAAGEENESDALSALGLPEVFARKLVHTGGEYEITPFSRKSAHSRRSVGEPRVRRSLFTDNEKMALKPKSASNKSEQSAAGKDLSDRYDKKRMIIMLSLLIITSPIWLCFMALFAILAFVFAFAVAALLLFMTIGGAVFTVLGFIRLFSIMPVGLALLGAGLLLLGISGIAFLPLLRGSVRLLCDTVKDIVIFIKNTVKNASQPRRAEVTS